jgi:hypothetical protein
MAKLHSVQTAIEHGLHPSLQTALIDPDRASAQDSSTEVRRARTAWTAQCLQRLRELRPDEDALVLTTTVHEMWREVSGFHPQLAAELEHECWD